MISTIYKQQEKENNTNECNKEKVYDFRKNGRDRIFFFSFYVT